MYRLRDLKNGDYEFHTHEGKAYRGSKEAVFTLAMEHGIPLKELKIAEQELSFYDHDRAEFGVFRSFLYTAKDKRLA